MAILANLLQAVAHRAMAAARSAGPAPWMTPRSFRASVQPNNGPAAARMAAVSRALGPSTPDLGRFTDKLMVCISSAFRPASPASSTAAASPCTKAVQSSTHVLTEGPDCMSLRSRHCWVTMARKKVANGQPAGRPDVGERGFPTASPMRTARSALYMANAGPRICWLTPARRRARSRNTRSSPS